MKRSMPTLHAPRIRAPTNTKMTIGRGCCSKNPIICRACTGSISYPDRDRRPCRCFVMRMNCNLLMIGNFHEPGSLVHQPVVRNRKQDGEIAALSARFLLQTKLLACKLALMSACFRLG